MHESIWDTPPRQYRAPAGARRARARAHALVSSASSRFPGFALASSRRGVCLRYVCGVYSRGERSRFSHCGRPSAPVASNRAPPRKRASTPKPIGGPRGALIDTVYVHGNTRVKTIAVLREMESRPGRPLDAVAVDRDQRYLGDLSPFATVAIHVEPIGEDRCVLECRRHGTSDTASESHLPRPRLRRQHRAPRLRRQMVRPQLSKATRKFLTRLTCATTATTTTPRSAWSTAWIGWKHIGVGGRASYFNRHEPTSDPTIFQQLRGQANLSIPLTERRISFSQIIAGVAVRRQSHRPQRPRHRARESF